MKLLIFSDIHGDKAGLERLILQDADYYFSAGDLTNFGRGTDRLGPVLQAKADRVYSIPGNHESESDNAQFCNQFGLHDFHGKSIQIGAFHVAGLGYSNPTPFNTPGEYSEAELADRLRQFEGLSPLVLICHCPPKGTLLDRAGEGQHFGSQSVREFIDRNQPAYFFCGHIHEAAGARDVMGKTVGVNLGKRGFLLELD